MPTISGLFSATGPVTIAAPALARTSASTASSSTSGQYGDMKQIYRRVIDLNEALSDAARALERLGGGRRSTGTGAATSAYDLGISRALRFSSLSSTEELNTVPTSYSTHLPSWSLGSTSSILVNGVYAGSTDATMSFEVISKDATMGGWDKIRLRVSRDGVQGEALSWPRNSPPDLAQTTADGLAVALGSGDVLLGDTFELQVYASVDSAVDPDAAFDGTGDDGPELEPGLAVTAGSFTVNDAEITVSADDSVQSVLDKVNAADAGVTAVYDPDTEQISLERDETGALDIVLADDTSGFLAAAKLDGATVVLGDDNGGADDPMASLEAFDGVVAGTFTVNGVEVAVDPDSDSLLDVMARIEAEVEGVSASYDADSERVTIAAEAAGEGVDLEDGGTGLLDGLALTAGPHEGHRHAGISRIASRRVTTALANVQRALDRLWDLEVTDNGAQNALTSVRDRIGQAISSGLGDGGDLLSAAGLQLDADADPGDQIMRMATAHLDRALRGSHGADLKQLLVGSARDHSDGLLGVMAMAGEGLEESLGDTCGSLGVYLDTWA